MHFPPGDLWNGVAPEILIDCARQLRDREDISQDDFCRALGAPPDEAMPVLKIMVNEGFFEPRDDSSTFAPTARLRQLALAQVSNGLTRAEAEALLERIIDAGRRVNRSPEKYSLTVRRIAVFGSYLGDKPKLGDLDVAVELSANSSLRIQPDEGVLTAMARQSSAESKIYSALRLRKSKVISIHTFAEVEHLRTPYRVVFEESSHA